MTNSYVLAIAKLLPLSFVVTEIDNYLEEHFPDDTVVDVMREIEDKPDSSFFETGIVKIAYAYTMEDRKFTVFFNSHKNQFNLNIDSDKEPIFCWNVFCEEN